MNPGEKFPSEFPSKQEQLASLEKDSLELCEKIKKLGIKEEDIDDLVNFPDKVNDLRSFSEAEKQALREYARKLFGNKQRKNFLDNDGREVG